LDFFSHTGYWFGLWDHPIPENGTPEANEMRCREFTIDRVLEWVEKYKNIDGRFCFFEVCACFSPLYQQLGKRLLSIKSINSMDVKRTAKPFKHCIPTKDRNRLSGGTGVIMFRSGQNLKHLHHAREAIKGKVYTGVLGSDSTRDAGVNAAAVSQAEVDDEILDDEEEM
jgi:hypothetical protein